VIILKKADEKNHQQGALQIETQKTGIPPLQPETFYGNFYGNCKN